MSIPSLFRRLLAHRHGGAVLFVILFLIVAWVTRVMLLVEAGSSVSYDSSLIAAFFWGLLYDFGTALLFAIPFNLLLIFLPRNALARRWGQGLMVTVFFALLCVFWFGAVAELLFWDEFSTRFNFIAVDYLVYTKEVIGNIQESYPMPLIFAAIFVTALGTGFLLWRTRWLNRWFAAEPETFRRRLLGGSAWIVAAIVVGLVLDSDQLPGFANNYNRELAKNGTWSLFAAFRNNELDYDQFYPTLPIDDAFKQLQTELAFDGSFPLSVDKRDTLRYVRSTGPEQHPNVIQITVESLSADFLSIFNHASGLTPNLEAISRKSLVFDRFYATGTRTDRGMEALTLAIPPTPGRSLIKRPRNENLFTVGSVFRSRGYDTAFIYGGYGYFDNMNYFFGNNGYRVIDRASVAQKDVTFANAWGACDEDLFRWTMREADKSYTTNKPFHYFVMTTSNHRPFTYPDGKSICPPKFPVVPAR